jgi:hypothetical protein
MMATRYMKHPTYVEAMVVTRASAHEVAEWIGGRVAEDPVSGLYVVLPKVKAPYNRARIGQYVVRYANGTITTSEPNVFDEVYTPA